MEGVITAAGHTLPSFAGYGGEREGAPFGRPFAGGAEMTSLVREALVRLRGAIDVANDACAGKERLDFWTGAATLNWILGNNTSTQSVCAAAAQMQVAYDYYAERVADPSTTDEQLADILVGINKNADVRDLIALAEATGAEAAARLAASAPGAALDAAGQALEEIGKGILKGIPWWAWAGGGVYLAAKLGWIDTKTFAKKK
jgi:hypothetical protein